MANKITLREYMQEHIQSLHSEYWSCPFQLHMRPYVNLSNALQATGHDTTELDRAIESIKGAAQGLKQASERAKAKFTREGILWPGDCVCEDESLE